MWESMEAVLTDISGVLYQSDETGKSFAIPGSIEAINRLREASIPHRFVTNESQITRADLVARLRSVGFILEESSVISPPVAVSSELESRGWRAHVLVHPEVVPDIAAIQQTDPRAPVDCVVIGDAGEYFTYQAVNLAFQRLMVMSTPRLVSMGRSKYYQKLSSGGGSLLMLDVGPYMRALEYAANVEAEVIGKPSEVFFHSALGSLGDYFKCHPERVVMIGDDIVSDVGAAQSCGMKGVQVRTGKYRPSDEPHATVTPDMYVENLKQAVDFLMDARK